MQSLSVVRRHLLLTRVERRAIVFLPQRSCEISNNRSKKNQVPRSPGIKISDIVNT